MCVCNRDTYVNPWYMKERHKCETNGMCNRDTYVKPMVHEKRDTHGADT